MFTKLSENNSQSLRNTDTDLRIHRFATSYGQCSYSYRDVNVLNKLSTEIKKTPSLATFKNLLKQSLKNQRVCEFLYSIKLFYFSFLTKISCILIFVYLCYLIVC